MKSNKKWKDLGWRHPLWNYIRFYVSLRGARIISKWEVELRNERRMLIDDGQYLPIPEEHIDLIFEYLEERSSCFETACGQLRTEEEAMAFCLKSDFLVGKTSTKSNDHHQSSKAMVSAVSGIAKKVCEKYELELDDDPQKRCVWFSDNQLHVTARNLDGAIPSLINPFVIWEIKEYWGKTKGGSKMSDAVYECQLVGQELRTFEEKSKLKINHLVFLDGREQWSYRKSDLKRFVDLLNQGLIDNLIVGKEVEKQWCEILENEIVASMSSGLAGR